ncbi:GGDEF domain-containing protein [Kiritimatiellaeota bacterium B1221]|nr:GGDEF domain-containing protein [Kiritimatiellaeota bacterium B1221]
MIPILEMLGVAVGSFAVLTLLVSYLRYRKMQLISLDQVEGEMDASAAVMVMLTALQESKKRQEYTLLLFEPVMAEKVNALRDFLHKNFRKEDRVFLLKRGSVLAFLQCPNEHLPATARRMVPLLTEAGFADGQLVLAPVVRDATHLLSLLEMKFEPSRSEGWVIHPGDARDLVYPEGTRDSEDQDAEAVSPGASVDPLTGVLKTELVPGAIRRLLAAQRRMGHSVTLVQVDLDELETYNASYGREIGDAILKQTAAVLMENCRESDLIGRWDEDAFMLCMVGKDDDLLRAAVRMSNQIKRHPLLQGETQIRFSAAFGLASLPNDGKNPVVLLERAGWALQEAKKRGRGTCVAFQPSLQPKASVSTAGENRPESF